jgi:hypothetical protein
MGSTDNRPDMHDGSPLLKLETRPAGEPANARSAPPSPERCAYPIVHGLSKREKKKKHAKCREFVGCLQSTTAPRMRLHARMPPSYSAGCDRPPNPAGVAVWLRTHAATSRDRRIAHAHDVRRRSCAQSQHCGTFELRPRLNAFPHDTMHPLTPTLARSRPPLDARPRACTHPSILPPPVAPPLVGAAPPPPAAAG